MSAISGLNRAIWLLLLARGGWWTAAEIEEELTLTPGSIAQRLQRLITYGSITRRPIPRFRRGAQYAVHNGCTIPQGMSVGEVIANATGNMRLAESEVKRPPASTVMELQA